MKQRIINLCNKLISHPGDDDKDFGIRVVCHVPSGFLMGLIGDRGLVELMKIYQRNEDRWTKDEAWKDLYGILVGYMIGRVIKVGLIIWLVVWILNKIPEYL